MQPKKEMKNFWDLVANISFNGYIGSSIIALTFSIRFQFFGD